MRPAESLALAQRPAADAVGAGVLPPRRAGAATGPDRPRENLYELVWQDHLRPGDRSVDVYIHKLRTKLETALPDWRFIHTHVGFGYRFSSEPSHAFHIPATAP